MAGLHNKHTIGVFARGNEGQAFRIGMKFHLDDDAAMTFEVVGNISLLNIKHLNRSITRTCCNQGPRRIKIHRQDRGVMGLDRPLDFQGFQVPQPNE